MATLALSPGYATDHTLFAGVRGHGIYRTVNGGHSWHLFSPPGWIVIALAISPAYLADRTLFAVSGLPTTGYGVHRSIDGGDTWHEVSPAWSAIPDAPRLAISPDYSADRTLYLLGGTHTYVSSDGGDSFALTGGWFATHQVADLAFSPSYAVDRTLYALVPGDGLYRSPDGGTTWLPTGLSDDLSAFAVSPGYAADLTLLAAGRLDGIVRISRDGGTNWAPVGVTLATGGQHTLLFSPTFEADRTLLVASATDPGPYRSADGGATWSPVGWYDAEAAYRGGFVGGRVLALALTPQDAYDSAAFAGTSSGLYLSSNRGENWYQESQGLARLTVPALAVVPGDPRTLLAGTAFFEHLRSDDAPPAKGDGSLQLSTDGGQSWRDVSGRLDRVRAVAFSPDFSRDGTAFAATGAIGQDGFYDGGIYRSTDGGQNWTTIYSDTVCQALAVSPDYAADSTLWAATSTYSATLGIQVSVDGGDTWAPLAPAVHAALLAPSPNYGADQTLFVGSLVSGLLKSDDGGASWSQVLTQPLTALALSPAYGASQTLYVAAKESKVQAARVFRSSDGGRTWQQAGTGIPPSAGGHPLTVPVLAFASDGSVLAGVTYGPGTGLGAVYRSSDGGQTWQTLGDGIGSSDVLDLVTASAASLHVYAGSEGGLWQIHVPQGGPPEPGTWETGGPRGGRAQALAVSPDFEHDGVAFVGGWLNGRAGGQSGLGIHRSQDGGQTWERSASGTNETPPGYGTAVHTFAFSPAFATDRTLYAGTWGGLYRSTDGGAGWEWVGSLYTGPPGSITALALAPDYPHSGQILAGGGWVGLYVSQDGGVSWTTHPTTSASSDIAYSPDFALDGTAYVAGHDGVYRTTDSGASWSPVLTSAVSALGISPAFGIDGTLFAGGDAVYLSRDGGTSWISSTLASGAPRVSALTISPDYEHDHTLFAGTSDGLYRSSDGGVTWAPVANYTGPAVLSLALSPSWPAHPVLLVGTAEGVYRSVDGPNTWSRTQGLATLATASLDLSSSGALLLTGAPNYGVYGSTDGGASWVPQGLQGGSWYYGIADLAISPAFADDGTLFAAWSSGVSIGAGVYRTVDAGQRWDVVYSTDHVGTLAISPRFAHDRTLYATGNGGRVVRSSDGGDTWSEVGDWPPGVAHAAECVALPPDHPADGTLFAGGGQGFWRLGDGDTIWEPAASGLDATRYVMSVAVSPDYASDRSLLAAAAWPSESGGAYNYGVYRSTDGGVHWQPSSVGLPGTKVDAVAFSPDHAFDHAAYATSGGLLYRSLHQGQTWTQVGAPPGAPVLADVAVDRMGVVYVSSDLGVWRYTTPAQDIVIDGGFEAGSGWEMPEAGWQASYSDRVSYAGGHAARIGLDSGQNVPSYSDARQTVTIPSAAISATLRFHAYPVSGEMVMAAPGLEFDPGTPVDALLPDAAEAGDAQYARVIDPQSLAILQTLFWDLSNAQTWQEYTYDLASLAGQTVLLEWGVYNDGIGGQTAMYVDDVSLVIAPPEGSTRMHSYVPLALR